MIRLAILGFLSLKPMTGYELDKIITSSLPFFWYIKQSQIYNELNKLDSENIISHELIIQKNRPNKKIYSISEKGKIELKKILNSKWNYNDFRVKKIPFLVKIFFGFLNEKDQIIKFLSQLKDSSQNELESLEATLMHVTNLKKEQEFEKFFWISTINFGIDHYKNVINWSENLIKSIELLEFKKNN